MKYNVMKNKLVIPNFKQPLDFADIEILLACSSQDPKSTKQLAGELKCNLRKIQRHVKKLNTPPYQYLVLEREEKIGIGLTSEYYYTTRPDVTLTLYTYTASQAATNDVAAVCRCCTLGSEQTPIKTDVATHLKTVLECIEYNNSPPNKVGGESVQNVQKEYSAATDTLGSLQAGAAVPSIPEYNKETGSGDSLGIIQPAAGVTVSLPSGQLPVDKVPLATQTHDKNTPVSKKDIRNTMTQLKHISPPSDLVLYRYRAYELTKGCPPAIRFENLKPEAQKIITEYVAANRDDIEVRYLRELSEVNKASQEPDMHSVTDYKKSWNKND